MSPQIELGRTPIEEAASTEVWIPAGTEAWIRRAQSFGSRKELGELRKRRVEASGYDL